MDNNNLMYISDKPFENLDNNSLSLKDNNIKHITKMELRNIKNIECLILVNNMIFHLNLIPFTLTNLYLSNNSLTNVQFYFEHIINVDFSLNNITFLPRTTNRASEISTLPNFHGNLITYIDEMPSNLTQTLIIWILAIIILT